MSNDNNTSGRRTWVDLCRVVAIYGVVLIHSCGAAFYQYGRIPLSSWLYANFLDSLVRCSVPLFVMLSGALLLKAGDSPMSIKTVARRIFKVFVPLLVWSAIYLIILSKHKNAPINWLSITTEPAMYTLWFVYMIIGIYLMLPALQAVFESICGRAECQIYLLVLWLVITCLPVYWPLPLLSLVQQTGFFGYGGYFVMGGILAMWPRVRLSTAFWLILFCVSVLITFGLTWSLSERANAPVETAYLYFAPNVFVSSFAAFVLFTRARVSCQFVRPLRWVAERSFFIFFVHVLSLEYVRYSAYIKFINEHTNMLVTIVVISLSTFAASLLIAALVRLLPGTQRALG